MHGACLSVRLKAGAVVSFADSFADLLRRMSVAREASGDGTCLASDTVLTIRSAVVVLTSRQRRSADLRSAKRRMS
jgi:hypothetical protein